MTMSQVLKFADLPKTQKPKYLENETIPILEMKKFVTPQGYNMAKNSFLSEVTFRPSLN